METMHSWLAPAPRNIAVMIKIRMLFGGMVNFFGWTFLFMGLFMIWVFEIPAVINSLYQFSSELETAEGSVIKYEQTSISENNRYVYETHYIFQSAMGEQYSGRSYAAGEFYQAGQKVRIEYKKDNPLYSRIAGMRAAPTDAWILFVLLFPFAGLIAVIIGLSGGYKSTHLLRFGEMAEGRLIKRERTSMRVNNRPVIKFTFEFKAKDGTVNTAAAKTHLWEELEDQAQEKILHDPASPQKAVLIDNLPPKLSLSTDGNFQLAGSSGGLFVFLNLLLPLMTAGLAVLLIL